MYVVPCMSWTKSGKQGRREPNFTHGLVMLLNQFSPRLMTEKVSYLRLRVLSFLRSI